MFGNLPLKEFTNYLLNLLYPFFHITMLDNSVRAVEPLKFFPEEKEVFFPLLLELPCPILLKIDSRREKEIEVVPCFFDDLIESLGSFS